MTDFTGPISAAFGLAASFIFDPLSCLWKVFNIEKGKNLISFGSSLRKPLHLLNYIFRFMLPELKEGSKVFELNKQIKSSDATEATKQLYLARRDRYINALFGITMSIGSIFEPLVHLKSQLFESNRFMTFMKNIFLRFNDCGLLRFFSRRREVQGRIIAETRRDWTSGYSSLPNGIKDVLSLCASCKIANHIIKSNPSGFFPGEAEFLTNVNYDEAQECIEFLKDFKSNSIQTP